MVLMESVSAKWSYTSLSLWINMQFVSMQKGCFFPIPGTLAVLKIILTDV